jgi:hypothetical protein
MDDDEPAFVEPSLLSATSVKMGGLTKVFAGG